VTDGDRRFVFLGSFEGGLPDAFEIPEEPLRKIEARLDAERAQREAEAAKAKLQIMQSARSQGRLKRALRAAFGRRRPSQ
jgi:hypothetical protein